MIQQKIKFKYLFLFWICLTVFFMDPGKILSVIGAVEVIAEHKGQPIPEATIKIFQDDKVIAEEKADRCGVALIPLEEGKYTVVIESSGKIAKGTLTIEPGKLISCTGNLDKGAIHINSKPINRYRSLKKSRGKKDYKVSSSDLDGLISYRFDTPHGSIYLGFPYYAAPGETISFSAILSPVGTSKKKIAKNLEKIKQYEIVIDDEHFALKEPTLWSMKARNSAKLAISSRKGGQPLAEIMANFVLHGSPASEPSYSGDDTVYHSTAGWPVCIPGEFDGIAENTQVRLGELEIEITAETASSVIFNPSEKPTGLQRINIVEGEDSIECVVRIVHLELTADKYDLMRGETTNLHLRIFGLEELDKTAYVSLINETTSVISMSGGNSQFFVIKPGEIGSGGVAAYDRKLSGIKRGRFVITAILTVK